VVRKVRGRGRVPELTSSVEREGVGSGEFAAPKSYYNNPAGFFPRDPRRNGVTHRQVDRHPRSKPASLSLAMGGTTPGTHAEMDTRINVHYRQEGICQCPLHASATLGPCPTHPCALARVSIACAHHTSQHPRPARSFPRGDCRSQP